MILSRYGSASSSVAIASSSGRWRRKHMIRLALIGPSWQARQMPLTTVSNGTPRAVWVCGSKKISAWRTLSACARAR